MFWRRKRKLLTDDATEVAPGEKWLFTPRDDSPWPPSNGYTPVLILDVQDGWVRYDMGCLFRDERKRTKEFVSMYRRVSPNR